MNALLLNSYRLYEMGETLAVRNFHSREVPILKYEKQDDVWVYGH